MLLASSPPSGFALSRRVMSYCRVGGLGLWMAGRPT